MSTFIYPFAPGDKLSEVATRYLTTPQAILKLTRVADGAEYDWTRGVFKSLMSVGRTDDEQDAACVPTDGDKAVIPIPAAQNDLGEYLSSWEEWVVSSTPASPASTDAAGTLIALADLVPKLLAAHMTVGELVTHADADRIWNYYGNAALRYKAIKAGSGLDAASAKVPAGEKLLLPVVQPTRRVLQFSPYGIGAPLRLVTVEVRKDRTLNALNMYDLLRVLDGQWTGFGWTVPPDDDEHYPRVLYARRAVQSRVLPLDVPDGLRASGQVKTAADFIAEKLAPTGRDFDVKPHIARLLLELNTREANDLAQADHALTVALRDTPNDTAKIEALATKRFLLANPNRAANHAAYVLASADHESGLGEAMREKYNPPEADYFNNKYHDMLGNGDVASGDGQRFKGRGYIQLTRRGHYRDFGNLYGVDLIADPELAASDSDLSARLTTQGMVDGKFTGVSLDTFTSNGGDTFDFLHARKIVNGMDCASSIQDRANGFANHMFPAYLRPVVHAAPFPSEQVIQH